MSYLTQESEAAASQPSRGRAWTYADDRLLAQKVYQLKRGMVASGVEAAGLSDRNLASQLKDALTQQLKTMLQSGLGGAQGDLAARSVSEND